MCVYFLLIHHLIDDEMNLQMFCGNHSLMLDAHTVTWSHVDSPSITCMYVHNCCCSWWSFVVVHVVTVAARSIYLQTVATI